MKKSTLLSLLTTAAIITTTAGTYATWDSLTATTNSSVTFSEPVTVTTNTALSLDETRTLGEISALSNVSFNIKDAKGLAKGLKIVPTISVANSKPNEFTINDFNITITDEDNSSTPLSGDKSNGFIDKSLNETNNYTVKVIPQNKTVAGKEVTVTLTAELLKEVN